jgi:hypothetical protein
LTASVFLVASRAFAACKPVSLGLGMLVVASRIELKIRSTLADGHLHSCETVYEGLVPRHVVCGFRRRDFRIAGQR